MFLGHNAGVWTIGLAKSGSDVGLGVQELDGLSDAEVRTKIGAAAEGLTRAGAHFVVSTIADVRTG